MSVDFDQFKETFITEAYELLEEMEEKLLGLDESELDLDEVNAVFRCAHSIKGGAGAFGFSDLVAFTHILEALLDGMREGSLNATQEVIDALLKSVDVVHHLVQSAQEGNEVEEGFGSELAEHLKNIVGGAGLGQEDDAPAAVERTAPAVQTEEIEMFGIHFVPHGALFASGNEPLLIIRELMRGGDVAIRPNIESIPELNNLDVEQCYIKWDIDVSTQDGIDVVREAFEFVEDECDLTIKEFGAVSLPIKSDDFVNDDTAGLFDDALVDLKTDDFVDDDMGGVFDDALAALGNDSDDVAAVVASPPVKESAKANSATKASPSAPATGKKSTGVSSIRVDIDKVDNLVNMVGELVITQAMIVNQTKDLPQDQFSSLLQGVEELSRHTRELQESVMSVRMQPVKSVFARMPRIVRDLSSQLGKDISIEMAGESTEIDKTVIEQLGDPLTHMIRNSVDHGIESPDDREAKGKPRNGTIKLSADNTGGRILIEVSDDGNGISRERVLAKAIEKGLFAADAVLSDEEIDNIIFMAGLSTAEEVTNVSGRGVGMDVVKRNIENLGGSIELENVPGEGSKFTVSLPLTLAILDGMIINIGEEDYIIPINNILESLKIQRADIQRVAEGYDVINVREEFIPIVRLGQVFNVPNQKPSEDPDILVVLVESGRDKYGLVIDQLVGQQQVVIKSIEDNADPVDGVSGATILGDGKVSLILDIARLQQMSINKNINNKILAA